MARLVRMCVKIAMVVAIPSCRAQARHPRLAVLKPRKGVDGGPAPTMTRWKRPCRLSRYPNAYAALSGPSPPASAATDGPDGPGHDERGASRRPFNWAMAQPTCGLLYPLPSCHAHVKTHNVGEPACAVCSGNRGR